MPTRLTHIPFDIETTGFETNASVTVVGFALPLGCRVMLNTTGHSVSETVLESQLNETFEPRIELTVHSNEKEVLKTVAGFLDEKIAQREYLLVAYNGERFNGGFDLPFLRTRYALLNLKWPFDNIPYADILPIIQSRFNTTTDDDEQNDLVSAYNMLIQGELSTTDPFTESRDTIDAFESGEFYQLLLHNIADVLRTQALASLAERYCGKSEFTLKSLTPTIRDPSLSEPRGITENK